MIAFEDIIVQFLIVITASLVGSFIFTFVFVNVLKHSILHSASKALGEETKTRIAGWLQAVVKDGITDALKDEKLKTIIVEIMELIREKLLKEDDHKK